MPYATLDFSLGLIGVATAAGGVFVIRELKNVTSPRSQYTAFWGWALYSLLRRRLAGWWVPFAKKYRENYERGPLKEEYKIYKSSIDDVATATLTTLGCLLVWVWYSNFGVSSSFGHVDALALGLAFLCLFVMIRTCRKTVRDVRESKAVRKYDTLEEDSVSWLHPLGALGRSRRAESARAPAAQETEMIRAKKSLSGVSEVLIEAEIVSGLAESYRKTVDSKEKAGALLKKRNAEIDAAWSED